MTQDKAHEPNQKDSKPGTSPTPRSVLTSEITQVMMIDRKKGITRAEYRVCNKGKPNGPLRLLLASVSSVVMPGMVADALSARARRV